MAEFVVIPDSSCDLSAELRERFQVPAYLRGVVYCPDGRQMWADMDWNEISPEEYFDSMKGKSDVLYKTAFAPQSELENVLIPFLEEGKDILLLTLSSGLSGTYQFFSLVAKELMEKYPERKVLCVDSLRYSTAEAILLIHANMKKAEGATIEETADYLNRIKHRIRQMGPLDDLYFCVKTGRISNLKAFFGTMVGVHCLGEFNQKGMPEVIGKVKGKQSALRATVAYMKEAVRNPEEQIVFVAHSAREEYAKLLAEEIRKEIKPKEVIINSVGMACGASIGPGLVAVFFLGDETSEDLTVEKQNLANVLKNMK